MYNHILFLIGCLLNISEDGRVFLWGSNSEGQLGMEDDVYHTPTELDFDENIIYLACGYYHTAIVTGTCGFYLYSALLQYLFI